MIDQNVLFEVNKKYKNKKRLFVPNKLIHNILFMEHRVNNIKHPGSTQMYRQLASKYFWPCMSIDCKHYVQQCFECQHGKLLGFH